MISKILSWFHQIVAFSFWIHHANHSIFSLFSDKWYWLRNEYVTALHVYLEHEPHRPLDVPFANTLHSIYKPTHLHGLWLSSQKYLDLNNRFHESNGVQNSVYFPCCLDIIHFLYLFPLFYCTGYTAIRRGSSNTIRNKVIIFIFIVSGSRDIT